MTPRRPPSALGVNDTWTVQDPDGATLAPVQWSDPGTIVKSLRAVPVMPTALTVIVVVPPLTRVTVRAVLVVPMAGVNPLVTNFFNQAIGTTSTARTVTPGATPVPVSETVCGELIAVLVTDSVPVRAPAALGAKATCTVQLPFNATTPPLVHVPPVTLKSPVAAIAVMVAVAVPLMLKVGV